MTRLAQRASCRIAEHPLRSVAALLLVAAALLPMACVIQEETWTVTADKTQIAVGEKVAIRPLEGVLRSGCERYGSSKEIDDERSTTERVTRLPTSMVWTVTPSTGHVKGGYFWADVPGTYMLTAKSPDIPTGPDIVDLGKGTLQIKVVPKANPLAGTWSWTEWWVHQKWSPETGVSIHEWVWESWPKPTTFTFRDQDGVVYASGRIWPEAEVKLDGKNVSVVLYVKSSNGPHWSRATCTGVLEGDTITGTVFYEDSASPPLEAPPPYTAEWAATRVK